MGNLDYRGRWRALAARVAARMDAGAEEYGGTSYNARPEALVDEIEEEILDIIGWAAILHERVQGLRQMVRRGAAEAVTEADTDPAPSDVHPVGFKEV